MTILNKDLEQRLKKLEMEQSNQETEVKDIGDLEAEMRSVEELLKAIENFSLGVGKSDEDYSYLRDSKLIEQLEDKLAHIDEEFNEKESALKAQLAAAPSTASSPVIKQKISGRVTTTSYVICLMFNAKSPPEWSGKGWSERGKGMRYATAEQAKQTLQKLKKQWPDYPLKIFKRG